MIDRQERNLGLDGDGAGKQISTILKDEQFRALNIDLEKIDPFDFEHIVEPARLEAAASLDDLGIRSKIAVQARHGAVRLQKAGQAGVPADVECVDMAVRD